MKNGLLGSSSSLNELNGQIASSLTDNRKSLDPKHNSGVLKKVSISNASSNLVGSIVYDSYWHFAAERQKIFFARYNGMGFPWTEDGILQKYKFTNAYRASDRVSQYLIRNVIYNDMASGNTDEVFFRIMLFKLFNKIETWEFLNSEIGIPTYEDFTVDRYDEILKRAKEQNRTIYSSAYIMPSGSGEFRSNSKHLNHLQILNRMMEDEIPKKIQDLNSMEDVYECLLQYPTIGAFLAFQYTIDLNYSEITNFDEMEFVVPGPGARDGIKKCFIDKGDYSDSDVIRFVTDHQNEEFEKRNIDFETLWGRKLQLIDCQNLFCEIDKYSRVAHPEVKGYSERNRIKAKFKPKFEKIDFFFPPKWSINEFINEENNAHSTSNQNILPHDSKEQLSFEMIAADFG